MDGLKYQIAMVEELHMRKIRGTGMLIHVLIELALFIILLLLFFVLMKGKKIVKVGDSDAKDSIVNVWDYAVDGIVDTNSFQMAIDRCCSTGDTLFVPDGEYVILRALRYSGDLKINMEENTHIVFMCELFLTNAEYIADLPAYSFGSLEINNGIIEGKLVQDNPNSQKACIQAGKLDSLTINNTKFINACYRNHLLDISGCKNVAIQGCYFSGEGLPNVFRPTTPNGDENHPAILEMIQIDLAMGLGVGMENEYSEIPSINIAINDCVFGCKENADPYILYRPIGIHNISSEGEQYSNIAIRDNEFVDCWGRAVGLSSACNTVIENNRFIYDNAMTDSSIVLQAQDPDGDMGRISNLIIRNNKVRACDYTYPFISAEYMEDYEYIENVMIINNDIPVNMELSAIDGENICETR